MTAIKKSTLLFVAIFTTFSLVGCATTTYHHGDGVIVAEKKVGNKDYKPHQATKTGATVAGSVGGASGAIYGGAIGFIVAIMSHSAAALVVAPLICGAAGALIVGSAAGVVGGGVGYLVDVSKPNAGVYEYTIKKENEHKPITVRQYSTPIPLHTPVRILEKDNSIFIEKK